MKVAELTKEQIEEWRSWFAPNPNYEGAVILCDMALAYLRIAQQQGDDGHSASALSERPAEHQALVDELRECRADLSYIRTVMRGVRANQLGGDFKLVRKELSEAIARADARIPIITRALSSRDAPPKTASQANKLGGK